MAAVRLAKPEVDLSRP